MFDTKFVIIVREDLAVWQKLNVTAFLSSGVTAGMPQIIGETYRDAAGHVYNALCAQPIIILSADSNTLSKIHDRAIGRGVSTSLYIEEMFATGHDAANREVFAKYDPATANVVGIAYHCERKAADKISKGARRHG
ncbi:DUF2000 family protein [Roseibium sp.]|uniref:DUF2000 family protein n=1 Tax=Roseibium sp. TaxID=1936156 RepID=UPI003A97C852